MKLTTMLLLVVLVLPALAEENPPDEKLCAIKTVFIEGPAKVTGGFRKNLEKRTWLTLENVKSEADAIFSVDKDGAVTITRQEPEEFLWQADTGNAFWSGCTGLIGSTNGCIFQKLRKAANCPKP